MKNLNEIENLVKEYINGGNEISSATTLPPIGSEISLKDVDGKTFKTRATQADVDNGTAKAVGEEIGDPIKFLAGTFEPSGTLSMATLLRSPDLTWDESLNTKSLRIAALKDVKLIFCGKEIGKSKSGRTYNIYRMRSQKIGAPKSAE